VTLNENTDIILIVLKIIFTSYIKIYFVASDRIEGIRKVSSMTNFSVC